MYCIFLARAVLLQRDGNWFLVGREGRAAHIVMAIVCGLAKLNPLQQNIITFYFVSLAVFFLDIMQVALTLNSRKVHKIYAMLQNIAN